MCPFKRWHQKKGGFLGRGVEQKGNGDIVSSQSEYATKLKGIDIDAERKRDRNAETTDEEKQQMRAAIVAVNWRVFGTGQILLLAVRCCNKRFQRQ